tara:strand:- start:1745 stop:2605 length:861 start_codon:yes stop_codon:yes gene_type:complete
MAHISLSFLDHIARCNNHDMKKFLPFVVDNETVGNIRRDHISLLEKFPDVFDLSDTFIGLAKGLNSYSDRTDAFSLVIHKLFENGVLNGWRGEPYPVGGPWGGPHAFEIERAAAPFFGSRAYGVHINGFVHKEDGIYMWIGRRAEDRPVCPGELDNMIAGGQPVTLSLQDNVIKEAGEEAGVPSDLAATAISIGAITYRMENETGLKQDTIFCWDLELPTDFIPSSVDGEISEFFLLPAAEVMEIVDVSFDFKFNCNLVNIDFFIRHGLLPPSHPDYEKLIKGLGQ